MVSDSNDAAWAQAGAARVQRLLAAYLQERTTLALALRGVSPELLAFDVEERDLASSRARAAQITGMLPFFVIMAVLYGALNAALGDGRRKRERGSLEPLLMNPARRDRWCWANGGAVASVAMLIAT